MYRLSFEDLCKINQLLCKESNEPYNIINKDNLLGALSVYDSYYETDYKIAAALFRSLIIAHGFQNANKRTACLVLMLINSPNCSDEKIKQICIDITHNSNIDINELVNELYNLNENINNKNFEVKENMNNKINIREELNKIDNDTFNEYDLRNMYDSCEWTKEEKKKIVESLKDVSKLNRIISGKFFGIKEPVKTKKVLNESADNSKTIYRIKYWETEEDRDWGNSEIFLDKFTDLESAKRTADKLFDEYASVEVVTDLDTDDEEVVYGRYPENESLNEKVDDNFDNSMLSIENITDWIMSNDKVLQAAYDYYVNNESTALDDMVSEYLDMYYTPVDYYRTFEGSNEYGIRDKKTNELIFKSDNIMDINDWEDENNTWSDEDYKSVLNTIKKVINDIGYYHWSNEDDEPQLTTDDMNAGQWYESLKEDKGQKKLGLPKSVTISFDDIDEDAKNDEQILEDEVNDYLSDNYGYCVRDWYYEIKGNDIIITDINWDISESLKENSQLSTVKAWFRESQLDKIRDLLKSRNLWFNETGHIKEYDDGTYVHEFEIEGTEFKDILIYWAEEYEVINESLNESKESDDVISWWKEVEDANEKKGWGFTIDNENYEDIDSVHAAMFDMIRELKKLDEKELVAKGIFIYNKYRNQDKQRKESLNEDKKEQIVILRAENSPYTYRDSIESTCTVGELINALDNYSEDTPVILGFDKRSYGFYSYGAIDADRDLYNSHSLNIEESLKESTAENILDGSKDYTGKPFSDFLQDIDHRSRMYVEYKDYPGRVAGGSYMAHDVPWNFANCSIISVKVPEDNRFYDFKIVIDASNAPRSINENLNEGYETIHCPDMSFQEIKDYCDAYECYVKNTGKVGEYTIYGIDSARVVDDLKADGLCESLNENLNEESDDLSNFSKWTDNEILDYIISNFKKITGQEIKTIFNYDDNAFEGSIFNQDEVEKTSDTIIDFMKSKGLSEKKIDDLLYELDDKLALVYDRYIS